jgi:hypothetical protein
MASSTISAEVSSQLPFMVRTSCWPPCEVNVAVALLPITTQHTVSLAFPTPYSPKHMENLTFQTTFHLNQFLAAGPLDRIRRMQMKVFFPNRKKVLPLYVGDLLLSREGQDCALDLQDGRAVCELDAEAVTGEGHDFLF